MLNVVLFKFILEQIMNRDYSMWEVCLKSTNDYEKHFAISSRLPIRQLQLKLAAQLGLHHLTICRGENQIGQNPSTPIEELMIKEGESLTLKRDYVPFLVNSLQNTGLSIQIFRDCAIDSTKIPHELMADYFEPLQSIGEKKDNAGCIQNEEKGIVNYSSAEGIYCNNSQKFALKNDNYSYNEYYCEESTYEDHEKIGESPDSFMDEGIKASYSQPHPFQQIQSSMADESMTESIDLEKHCWLTNNKNIECESINCEPCEEDDPMLWIDCTIPFQSLCGTREYLIQCKQKHTLSHVVEKLKRLEGIEGHYRLTCSNVTFQSKIVNSSSWKQISILEVARELEQQELPPVKFDLF